MTTCRAGGEERTFGHVKGHLWGFRGLHMMDRVPLQVAVISPSQGREGPVGSEFFSVFLSPSLQPTSGCLTIYLSICLSV